MKHDESVHTAPSKKVKALVVIPLVVLAVILTGCARVAAPKGWASPVEANGVIYATVESGKIAAIDARSGQRNWTYPTDKDDTLEGIYGTPIVRGTNLYVAGYNGVVAALNTADGNVRWRTTVNGKIIGGIVATNDTLYVPTDTGMLYSLSLADGNQLSSPLDVGGPIWSTPVLNGAIAYVTTMDGSLAAVNLNERSVTRVVESSHPQPAAPAVWSNTIIYGGLDKRLKALNATSFEELWSFPGANWFWMQPLIANQVLYAADLNGNLYALKPESGEMVWSQPFKAATAIKAQPALAEGTLIVVDREGHVYGLDPRTGSQQWNMQTLSDGVLSDPSVTSRSALILQENGALTRLDAATGALTPIVQK